MSMHRTVCALGLVVGVSCSAPVDDRPIPNAEQQSTTEPLNIADRREPASSRAGDGLDQYEVDPHLEEQIRDEVWEEIEPDLDYEYGPGDHDPDDHEDLINERVAEELDELIPDG